MKPLLLLLIVINFHLIQGVLEWTVTEKVTDFGQNVTLFCHVPHCCPKDSGWDRWTPNQRTLFIDVKTGRSNKKYDGKALRDGYTLVIQNLTKEDLNVSYSCLYGVTLGQTKFLLEEDVFIYKSDTTPNDNRKFSEIQIAGIIIGIVVPVAAVVVFFVILLLKKRKTKTNVTIEVKVPLLLQHDKDCFLEDPSSVEYIEGDDAILTCKVSTTSLPVEWLKDGNPVKLDDNCIQSNEGTKHNLIIKNAKSDDSGKYCAKVGNFSRNIHLKIEDCFLEEPSSVEYIEGEDAILSCKVSPTSLPVEWLKEGKVVKLDENCLQSNEGTKHNLIIENVKLSDSGKYWVTVGNFSRKIQLKIEDCFLEEPSNVEYIEGEDAILTCKVIPISLPMEWLKDGKVVQLDENCFQSKEGTTHNLIIKSVKSDDSGKYCVKVGNFSRKIQLKIEDCFLGDPASDEYTEGEDAILTCKVSPTSLPVEWMKDGHAVKLDEHCEQSNEGTKHNLIIKNVKLDDSGKYCVKVGNFSRTIQLKIRGGTMNHDEVIPKHIQEQFERRLEQWKEADQLFVSTEAEKHVMQKVLTQSSVTLVGNSGTGKSFLSKHIALILKKHGYTVIPCNKPEDIGKWFKHGRKTLFVFDDVCGRYTLNQQIYTDWKQNIDSITSLLTDQCCKIISTCRLEVYNDERFRYLSIFKMCNIDLSSREYKLSAAEQNALAEVYFTDNNDEVKELSEKYDFFPLLCSLYHKQNLQKNISISSFFSNPFDFFKDQLEQMYGESDAGKMQYCSLVICVMFNHTLTEENWSIKDEKIEQVLNDFLAECELSKDTPIKSLKKSLEALNGTYVVKEDSTYKIIHDKLFDFLAKYFGEKMLKLFFYHANTDFIAERFIWKITDSMSTEIEFVIQIPDTYIDKYIERLLRDWKNGYVYSVCHNRNMNSIIFTEIFLTHLNQLDPSKQQKLVCTKDIHSKDIALSGSCYMGTVNLVKWLISMNSDINYSREDGSFPLLWASQEGHVDVVKELIQHSADVNKCNNEDASPLYGASHNGHVDVVKELLQHSADVNKCANDGTSHLCIASQNGHVDVVKELIQHSADVNKCNNDGTSHLCIASQNGHVDVVKELIQHSADVNKCNNDGTSPLCIASNNGHVDVVNELIQHSADVNKCDNEDISPLYGASQNGHVDVIKELIQHSADVNKCDNEDTSPLYVASQNGHVDVIKELIQHSADVNKCNNDGTSPLYIASQNGHVDVIKELLQHSADVNKCNNDDVSPLYIASYNGHVNVVKELIQHSANVNKCNNDDTSPLFVASHNGHVNVFKELIQHSADVNKCNNDGTSPLCIASNKGHVDVVKELIQHSADVNKCNNDDVSPLYIASYNGHVNVVKELIQHSADVNKCDNDGTSPLYIASQNGHVNVVKELIQHSADVNKCDNDGTSPLYIASQNGHVDVIKELLQHSADVNKCYKNDTSPLYIASEKRHVDVVKELIQHSADVNKCNNEDTSPLCIASENGHVDVVKELIQHSADFNTCNNEDISPLYKASQNGHGDVVKELIQHSADVNTCNNDGTSPLSIASQNGHVDVFKELLQHSVDVNKCDNDGTSPLCIASHNGHVDVVKELIQHSADVNKCDNNGMSPLYRASHDGHVDVVKELIQHSADVNKCNNEDISPLYIASQTGHVDVVKELIQHSADVNKCNNEDVSPLYIASQTGHVDVVKEMIQHSADVNKCANDGTSPLCIASENGHVDVVKELIQHSADVNKCANDGLSPLCIASHSGHVDVVKELIQHSADVNKCNNEDISPLSIASQNGHVDVVKELIQHSADVNKCNNEDISPLYRASQNGHVDVVKELLNHSADVNKCDDKGQKPLYVAHMNGHLKIEELLLGTSASQQ